jgi:RND family efflux transporter MFP subunit
MASANLGRLTAWRRCAGLTVLLLLVVGGCTQRNTYVPPPPPEVSVTAAEQREITIYHDFTGTTEASNSVQIRARVTGYLEKVQFQEGASAAEGQVLFVIDQRPYVAQLDQAKANLESRKAAAAQQQSVYRRSLSLLQSGATTQEQIDIDRGNWLVAQSAVAQAEAMVRQAQLNLDYTEVKAPFSGRIGRRLVDVGNLVVTDTTLLTTMYQYDPIYAYFTVSETDYLDYRKRQREKNQGRPEKPTAERRPPIEMELANETDYPHHGYIDFAEPTVNPGTGTLLLRGVFANPEPYRLAPGLFVRLRVPNRTEASALLVPESALGTDQTGRFLLIVRPDHVVEHRSVTVGPLEGAMRVIERGLKPGEQFVVEGLERARPGAKVQPVEAQPSQLAAHQEAKES